MCDFPDQKPYPNPYIVEQTIISGIKYNHDCHKFDTLELKPCTLCNKMTCGFTRVCNIEGGHYGRLSDYWEACLNCSKRAEVDAEFREYYISQKNKAKILNS